MLLAAIDIGTVTARLALAQVEDGRVIRMAKYTQIVNLTRQSVCYQRQFIVVLVAFLLTSTTLKKRAPRLLYVRSQALLAMQKMLLTWEWV